MTEFLDLDDLLDITSQAVGGDVVVGDYGLLESALARPRASVFGQDAYPHLHLKAAALLHSLSRNHPLVDGNKRLAWTACRTFLAINGQWIDADRGRPLRLRDPGRHRSSARSRQDCRAATHLELSGGLIEHAQRLSVTRPPGGRGRLIAVTSLSAVAMSLMDPLGGPCASPQMLSRRSSSVGGLFEKLPS